MAEILVSECIHDPENYHKREAFLSTVTIYTGQEACRRHGWCLGIPSFRKTPTHLPQRLEKGKGSSIPACHASAITSQDCYGTLPDIAILLIPFNLDYLSLYQKHAIEMARGYQCGSREESKRWRRSQNLRSKHCLEEETMSLEQHVASTLHCFDHFSSHPTLAQTST